MIPRGAACVRGARLFFISDFTSVSAMRRSAFFVFGLVVAFGLSACSSRTEVVTPRGDVSVTLDASAKRTTHTVEVANRVHVTLPPADATHGWQISYHDARFLKQVTEVTPPKTPEGSATITFLAIKPTAGRTTRVRFVLLPVGAAREATPIDGHDLVLTIQ